MVSPLLVAEDAALGDGGGGERSDLLLDASAIWTPEEESSSSLPSQTSTSFVSSEKTRISYIKAEIRGLTIGSEFL